MLDQASTDVRSRFDGVIVILAILLIAEPWLLGYSGDHDATATSLVAGLAIFACVFYTLSEYTHAFREIDLALGVLTRRRRSSFISVATGVRSSPICSSAASPC